MNKLIFKGPLNSLSLGNVSYNFLRELYLQDYKVSIFPVGDNINLSAYDKIDEDFKKWIESSFKNRLITCKKDQPTLQVWHLSGSESRVSSRQFLYTFYELDSPTLSEKNLVDMQDHVFFSSSHARNCFSEIGSDNVSSTPLGWDPDFFNTDKEYLKNKIHFGLIGKFEKRKHTQRILEWWIEKYGNNYDFQLSCCIINPFYKPEQMNQAIAQCLKGKKYGNINFLPYLKTNSEVNDLMNAVDINLSGLSGGEGWNLPAFNSACLGKWPIVLNSSSHKDWANSSNCILVEPNGEEEAYDNIFFNRGSPFNQGSISNFSKESFYDAVDKSINKNKNINIDGQKLKEKFSYKKTIKSIMETVKS